MRVQVTEQGLLIPKMLLGGIEEVDVRWENDTLIIVTVPSPGISPDDPIYHLGSDPATDSITDASVNHDKYLYGP